MQRAVDGQLGRDSGRRLQALAEISRLVTLGLDERAILQHVTEAISRLLDSPYARLWTADESGDLVLAATAGPLTSLEEVGVRRPASQVNLNQAILAGGRLYQTPNVNADPRWHNRAVTEPDRLHTYVGVPLIVGRRRYGILTLLFREQRVFGPEDLELIETVAAQASAALANARLYDDTRRRAAEALAVAEVGRAITGSLDLQAVLELIVEQACRLLGTQRCGLAILESDEIEAKIHYVARRGMSEQFPTRMRPRHQRDGTTPVAIAGRRPVWSADVLNDPAFDLTPATRAAIEAEGYRAVLSLPLLTGERALGALVVYRDTVGPFSDEEVELLRVFCDQAVIAIQNARAFQQEQERRRQLEAIRDLTAEITRELDHATLLGLINRRSVELVGGASGVIYLWDEAGQVLVPRTWHGLPDWLGTFSMKLGEGTAGTAAARRHGVIDNDYRTSPHAHPIILERTEITANLGEPILYQGRLIGAIVVCHEDPARTFGEHDRELLRLFADQAAVAIERSRLLEQLEHQALHDSLTGLPNRALFLDRLEHALARADRHRHPIAVLFLDLDNFKVVNDSLGHEAGDQLLVAVARRLRACLRASDTAARLGGDEFTVLLEDIRTPNEALKMVERIAGQLRRPVELCGRELSLSASIGVVLSASGRDRPDDLLRDADVAMYRAKHNGKARHELFEPSMNADALERFELESDLRGAVERGEFRLVYQPIVALDSGRIVELEALLRWEHPRRGLIPPAKFIRIAEETRLIVPIGRWVLEEACRRLRTWQLEFPAHPPLGVSVNVSAEQFQDPNLIDDVTCLLRDTRLPPHCLELELTESAVMADAAAAVATLKVLKGLGVRLALDDFGTGYSSLSHLRHLPLDTVKIDRSFIQGVGQDTTDAAIVQGVVALAKTLNLTVTAEGIETPEQLSLLQSLGCDLGQGYHLARPLSTDAVTSLLATPRPADGGSPPAAADPAA